MTTSASPSNQSTAGAIGTLQTCSGALPVGPGNNDVEGTKGSTNIDASASWKLNDQWELTFEGLNLTDEFNDQWVDSNADRSSVYHHTGRQYFVGFRFKL